MFHGTHQSLAPSKRGTTLLPALRSGKVLSHVTTPFPPSQEEGTHKPAEEAATQKQRCSERGWSGTAFLPKNGPLPSLYD